MHPSEPERWVRLNRREVAEFEAGLCPFLKMHAEYPLGSDRCDRRLRPVVGYECSDGEDPEEVARYLCCSLDMFFRTNPMESRLTGPNDRRK
jgi:hypothetical protein